MPGRALLLWFAVTLIAGVASGCGGDAAQRPSAPRSAATAGSAETATARRVGMCPVTMPNHDVPPGQDRNPGAARAPYHGNGQLWTVLSSDGTLRRAVRRDGSVEEKFPWWRGGTGRLRIAGHRLDAPGPPLRARIPGGYGPTEFQASSIIFPSPGCWQVTSAAGDATLSFVTLVVRAAGQ